MPLDKVPVIDIAPFVRGGAADKRRVATEIRRACEEIGFFTIAGHDVPAADFDEARRQRARDGAASQEVEEGEEKDGADAARDETVGGVRPSVL